MPGGKMHFHETFEELCARETLEETGLIVNKDTIKIISVTNDMVPDKHYVTIGFLATDIQGEPKVMEPDEITQWQRFDLHDLPTPMYFPSEKLIKNYLAGTVYQQ